MAEYRHHHAPRGVRRHRSLVIALAAVLVGGVGFAATGGPELVRNFVRVRLIKISGDTDGPVELNLMLEPDASGDGTATATIGSVDGESTTITLERQPAALTDDGQERTQITVQVAGTSPDQLDAATAEIELAPVGAFDASAHAEGMNTFVIRREDDGTESVTLAPIGTVDDEHAMIWDWVDGDGLNRELHLIPDAREARPTTYTVLTGLLTDNDMHLYRTVGTFAFEGVVADVLDIVEGRDGSLTLEILDDDGYRQTIEISGKSAGTNDGQSGHFRLQRSSEDVPE